jgi:hypothetical protein
MSLSDCCLIDLPKVSNLLGNRLVSMPHGPGLSMTLNLMDGDVESQPGGWETWISAKENHQLSLRKPLAPEDLDELSSAEWMVLEAVWRQLGGMDQWEIRDWIHRHCPEWQDPHGSSCPISEQSLAGAVGFDEAAAHQLAAHIEAEHDLDRLFATL